jgi:hypothetical protein
MATVCPDPLAAQESAEFMGVLRLHFTNSPESLCGLVKFLGAGLGLRVARLGGGFAFGFGVDFGAE